MTSDYLSPQAIEAAAAAIRQGSRHRPAVALVLGSGLNQLADAVEQGDTLSTAELPHWPKSTVPGHEGRLVLGQLEGTTLLVMQGRSHFYEGLSVHAITFPVRVMHRLGIRTLILTNAAGGINPAFAAGDLMAIADHINFPGLAGNNPLRGPNDDSVGPRFPDMTEPYDRELRQLAHTAAAEAGFELREGTYTYVAGPSYETPAELRFLRTIGADAVGMSTVPSVVVARHAGMRVLGLSTITNMALPDPAPGTVQTHSEVLETGQRVVPRLTALLHGLIRQI